MFVFMMFMFVIITLSHDFPCAVSIFLSNIALCHSKKETDIMSNSLVSARNLVTYTYSNEIYTYK